LISSPTSDHSSVQKSQPRNGAREIFASAAGDLAGLGGGIIGLPHLAFLAVDGRDVDDAAELALAHALDQSRLAVQHDLELGAKTQAFYLAVGYFQAMPIFNPQQLL
jgi:hypothetical protein